MSRPVRMKELAPRLVHSLISMSPKVIPLGLKKVGRQDRTAVAIKKANAVLNAGTGIPRLAAAATTVRQPFCDFFTSPLK